MITNLSNLHSLMANDYLVLTKKISTNKFITDKLPQNFMFIGFILAMFPNCKIIHCQRNPKSTCLSIFKNYFPDSGIWYAYDTNDLIEYYRLYEEMMEFWNKLFPGKFFNLKYENVISDQLNSTRALLKFCNFEWEDNCTKFYDNLSAVKTLSTSQVRSSIYTGSLNKFENYKSLIPNFLEKI